MAAAKQGASWLNPWLLSLLAPGNDSVEDSFHAVNVSAQSAACIVPSDGLQAVSARNTIAAADTSDRIRA